LYVWNSLLACLFHCRTVQTFKTHFWPTGDINKLWASFLSLRFFLYYDGETWKLHQDRQCTFCVGQKHWKLLSFLSDSLHGTVRSCLLQLQTPHSVTSLFSAPLAFILIYLWLWNIILVAITLKPICKKHFILNCYKIAWTFQKQGLKHCFINQAKLHVPFIYKHSGHTLMKLATSKSKSYTTAQ